jgi:hypothetical protein
MYVPRQVCLFVPTITKKTFAYHHPRYVSIALAPALLGPTHEDVMDQGGDTSSARPAIANELLQSVVKVHQLRQQLAASKEKSLKITAELAALTSTINHKHRQGETKIHASRGQFALTVPQLRGIRLENSVDGILHCVLLFNKPGLLTWLEQTVGAETVAFLQVHGHKLRDNPHDLTRMLAFVSPGASKGPHPSVNDGKRLGTILIIMTPTLNEGDCRHVIITLTSKLNMYFSLFVGDQWPLSCHCRTDGLNGK